MKTLRLVPVLLLAATLGCGSSDTSVDTPGATTVTPDEKVLLALDYYEPMYKLDGDGHVTQLRLPNRHLTPEALADIGKLSELHKLDLYGATVTDDGLAQLKNLQKLHNLGLGGTQITDKGLVHLEKLTGLRHIWLPKEKLSKAAIDKLKTACPELSVH